MPKDREGMISYMLWTPTELWKKVRMKCLIEEINIDDFIIRTLTEKLEKKPKSLRKAVKRREDQDEDSKR